MTFNKQIQSIIKTYIKLVDHKTQEKLKQNSKKKIKYISRDGLKINLTIENKNLLNRILKLNIEHLNNLSEQLNIEIPTNNYLKSVHDTIINLTDTLTYKINIETLEYLSLNSYLEKKELIDGLSKRLNKTIVKLSRSIEEVNVIMNRTYIKKQYLKVGTEETVLLEYAGPLDELTSKCCRSKIGVKKTMKEWENIKLNITKIGCHPYCRHYFIFAGVKEVKSVKGE